MYDIAIVGGGPAGVSAAINAKLLNKSFIWFASGATSAKAEKAELVNNYPGLPKVTGAELSWAFLHHAESLNVEAKREVITGIYEAGGEFILLAGEKDSRAKTVILCTGVQTFNSVPGEEKFLGRGISYCPTCDGMLCRGKKVAVVLADKMFERDAEFIAGLASECTVIPLYKNCGVDPAKVKFVYKTPVSYEGGERLEKIVFSDGFLSADRAFILKPAYSPTALVRGLKTEGGHVCVDRALRTNIPGIFAAGDCTGRPYQYAKAVGEGNVAVHSAAEYLAAAKTGVN